MCQYQVIATFAKEARKPDKIVVDVACFCVLVAILDDVVIGTHRVMTVGELVAKLLQVGDYVIAKP